MGFSHVATEHLAGVAFEGGAVEMVDVAEDACFGHLGVAPGEQLEGVGVGNGEHVGFLHAGEPVDRGAVEGHPVLECVLEFGRRDRQALQIPEHVGEPESHESDAAFFDAAKDVVALLVQHVGHSSSLSWIDRESDRAGAEAPALPSVGVGTPSTELSQRLTSSRRRPSPP